MWSSKYKIEEHSPARDRLKHASGPGSLQQGAAPGFFNLRASLQLFLTKILLDIAANPKHDSGLNLSENTPTARFP